MKSAYSGLVLAFLTLAAPAFAAPPSARIVFCAPGYPGSTADAQSTMDAFAKALAHRTGWPSGAVSAVYHETEEAGLAALRDRADLAVVPLPFFVKHAAELRLSPILLAVPEDTGVDQSWTLVAKTGRISVPADLAGWEIVSLSGYAPSFVRDVVLARWGPIPGDVTVRHSSLVLSSLRQAAQGSEVAVLLDGPQSESLRSLPFAGELAVAYRSAPLPVSVVARVGTKSPGTPLGAVERALAALASDEAGRVALSGLRMRGFVTADDAALETLRGIAAR
jgi:hypothetical protein